MTTIIDKTDFNISIIYISTNLEKYQYIITKKDSFFSNFLETDSDVIEKTLKKGEIIHNNTWCIFRIKEPICWNFIMNKCEYNNIQQNENIIILDKLNKLDEKIKNVEQSISHLINKITNGVILPGYSDGVIDQSCTQLRLVSSLAFYVNGRPKSNIFAGSSIEPLTRLENLEDIIFENYNGFDFDLSPLKNCRKLKKIIFINCFHYILSDFGRKIVETREENKQIFDISDYNLIIF